VAEDELHGLVCGEFGDGESVFEFDPPPPITRTAKSYFEPALFVLDCNDSVQETSQEDGIFSDGFCSCCGAGLGKRTKKARTLSSVPKCDVSFVPHFMPAPFFNPELCKALFHLVGEAEFGVLGWPLAVLMLLRQYQVYVAYGFTAAIIITFFISQFYLVQIEHSIAIVHVFAIHLQCHPKHTPKPFASC